MSQKEVIDHYISKQLKLYQDLALDIHSNPEVSNYEFHSSEVLSNQLIAEGFEVTVDVAGHRTGFEGRYRSNKPGPVVVFLAEYDALGGVGHACGHNLFGTTAILAASSLKQLIDDVGGEVRVYGTPGEEGGENGSAKGSFVREGFLD
ncbi:MAG: amidohydrolase, partial [Leuconostoc mesenteroides]